MKKYWIYNYYNLFSKRICCLTHDVLTKFKRKIPNFKKDVYVLLINISFDKIKSDFLKMLED